MIEKPYTSKVISIYDITEGWFKDVGVSITVMS